MKRIPSQVEPAMSVRPHNCLNLRNSKSLNVGIKQADSWAFCAAQECHAKSNAHNAKTYLEPTFEEDFVKVQMGFCGYRIPFLSTSNRFKNMLKFANKS